MLMSDDIFTKIQRIVIAGSGPAGLTAAVYAARADLEPIMIEGFEAGGQLVTTTHVENYPGFPAGIMGPDLIENMRKQAERFGTRILRGNIKYVDLQRRPFAVELEDGHRLRTHTFIIATGASAKWLGLESEQMLRRAGGGVTACATCDGAFYRGKEVIVIGGGDTAMEEAMVLTKFASKVTVIHRRDVLRASKIMQQRAFDNPKIRFIWDTAVEEVLGVEEKRISAVRLHNLKNDEETIFPTQGMFLAIGHTPNIEFLGNQVKTDANGFIMVNSPRTTTSIQGVFAAGDVADPIYRQAITAAGTGCAAALDAERYLEANGLAHPHSLGSSKHEAAV
jgi:thioredoxin reductase (NADPH)